MHLTLCKTGLNAEEKGQLFFNSEFKEFLLPFCTGRNNWKSTCGYVARMWQNQSYLYTFGSYTSENSSYMILLSCNRFL